MIALLKRNWRCALLPLAAGASFAALEGPLDVKLIGFAGWLFTGFLSALVGESERIMRDQHRLLVDELAGSTEAHALMVEATQKYAALKAAQQPQGDQQK